MKPWSSVGIKPVGAFLIIQKLAATITTNAAIAIHLCPIRYLMLRPYLVVVARKPALNPRKNLFTNPVLCPSSVCGFFKNKAHNAGLKVKAFKAEIKIAVASVNANCL